MDAAEGEFIDERVEVDVDVDVEDEAGSSFQRGVKNKDVDGDAAEK